MDMDNWKSTLANISYHDFGIICRICLCKENLRSIQELEYLVDLLGILSGVEVKADDGLPQSVCDSCIYKLEEISDFIDLTKYNHMCLKQVYVTKSDLKVHTTKQTHSGYKKHMEEPSECVKPMNTVEIVENICSSDVSGNVVELEISEPEVFKVDIEEFDPLETQYEHNENRNSSTEADSHCSFNESFSAEEIGVLRRRARNRRAAAKRRKKVQEYWNGLTKEADCLESANLSLKTQIKELETQKVYLLSVISEYKCTKGHLDPLEKKPK